MTHLWDRAIRAMIAACVLFATVAICATYLCAVGAVPCADHPLTAQCPYDARAQDSELRGTFDQAGERG
jgi:hypothetical protein